MPPIPDVAGGGYHVKRRARAKPRVKRKPKPVVRPDVSGGGYGAGPAQARPKRPVRPDVSGGGYGTGSTRAKARPKRKKPYSPEAAKAILHRPERQQHERAKAILHLPEREARYQAVARQIVRGAKRDATKNQLQQVRVELAKGSPRYQRILEEAGAAKERYDSPFEVARRARTRKTIRLVKKIERAEKKDPTGQLAVIRAQVANPKQAKGFIGAAGKLSRNVLPDAYELAVTTPSSVAKLVSTAVKDPAEAGRMVIEPYKQLAKDPGKFITEKPVTTLLMVSPAGRVPGRAAGKVARLTGRQTLARPAATLPGTALRQERVGSRDYLIRKFQERKDKREPAPKMTETEVGRRVDEFYDVGKKHERRAETSAAREARKRFAALPKAERKATTEKHLSGAREGAKRTVKRKFAEEFGATAHRTPGGAVVKPKQAEIGHLHKTREDAQAIQDRLGKDNWTVMKVSGDQYAVVPKTAHQRLEHHQKVGTSKAGGARLLRVGGKTFRTTVLPASVKWMTGQVTEAGIRAAAAGAGPASYLRQRKVVRALEKERPGAGREFEMRAMGGGQFGTTATAREFARNPTTLADEFAGVGIAGKTAKALTKAGAKPGIKHARAGWRRYSDFVFDTVNGTIERTTQRAMLGKAIKESPLMERRIIGLSDKAVAEAAKGLRGTDAQVQLGRVVDRMYGRYQKFSPDRREALLHWTPFLPWYLNMAEFLTRVLPGDHPVKASLLASASSATQEWREAQGLSTRGGETKPHFLLGGAPGGGGVIRVGRYAPALPADVLGSASDLVLPQYMGAIYNAAGIDWTGKRLKHPGYKGREFNQKERAARTALTLAETHVPLLAQTGRVTGLPARYVDKKDVETVLQGKSIPKALRKEVDPFMPTGSENAKPKPKVKKKGSDWGGSGSGSGWG